MSVDVMPLPADRMRMRWRTAAGGPGDGHAMIVAQAGPTPQAEDQLVCIADTPEVAAHIVAAHNEILRKHP